MQFKTLSLKTRLLILTVLLATLPLLLDMLLELFNFKREIESNHIREATAVARFLEKRLDSSFSEILEKHNASTLPKDQQVKVLNLELQPVIDDVTSSFDAIGAGYYCRELDSIIAYGPNPDSAKLTALPGEHPSRDLYITGKPVLYKNSGINFFRGTPLLAYNLPIYRNGELIGHTWGSIPLDDLSAAFWRDASVKFLVISGFLVLSLFLVKRVNNDISSSLNYFTEKVLYPEPGPLPANSVFCELMPVYTAVQRAQKTILDHNRLLETLLDSTNAGILCTDENGNIILFNRAMERIFSLNLKDFDNRPFETFIQKTDIPCNAWPIYQSLRTRKNISSMLIPLRVEKDVKWVSSNAVIITDSEDNFRGVLGTFHDITDVVELENQALDIERFKIVGELAASISHEVRNPLTTVKGFLQLFLNRNTLSREDKELYQLMVDEIDRANNIIRDFLSVSRQQNRMNETFMINTIIGELLLLFKSKALLHDVQIETDLTQTPPVRGDRDQLKQVFLNLFNNSVEAMPGGGTIIVRTAYDPSGKYVLIKIKDTGPGIPAEILDRLGKPFVTTKKTGTGLGLSLCYRIINHHFGKISVTTSPEWGTEFVITLPAINAEAPESCCLA
ncbi:MAG: hypothetical protein CVU89_08130 [Firmicutes bacterium HGW-Firmicutes-14]|nr:MAG: hypothetical protein CVU89_08130 [Firmicutes bacterium HGW-Firmicutes-14]